METDLRTDYSIFQSKRPFTEQELQWMNDWFKNVEIVDDQNVNIKIDEFALFDSFPSQVDYHSNFDVKNYPRILSLVSTSNQVILRTKHWRLVFDQWLEFDNRCRYPSIVDDKFIDRMVDYFFSTIPLYMYESSVGEADRIRSKLIEHLIEINQTRSAVTYLSTWYWIKALVNTRDFDFIYTQIDEGYFSWDNLQKD